MHYRFQKVFKASVFAIHILRNLVLKLQHAQQYCGQGLLCRHDLLFDLVGY